MNSLLIGILLVPLFLTPPPVPKYDWLKTGSETFSLNASEPRYFLIKDPARWRFDFKAEEAIFVGVATAEQFGALRTHHLTNRDFNHLRCVKRSTIEATVVCNVSQPNARWVLRDRRGPITRLTGAAATIKGSGAMADRASKPNKVKVTLYQWACIENCPN
jgi:hypothetical protein